MVLGRTHNNKPPDYLPAGTGVIVGTIEPDPDVQIQAVEIRQPEPQTQTRKAYKNEKEIHRAALDYYCALEAERTLQKVAEAFGKHYNVVALWSASFDWVERAKEFDNKSDDLKHIEKELKIVRMQANACIKIDEAGREVLTKLGESAEKQNLRARTALLLKAQKVKALAEASGGTGALTKPDRPGNGNGKHPGGMMVNVIIKK